MTWNKESIWKVLDTNNEQVGKALLAMYERQTEDEQATNQTNTNNGIGFNGVDAPFLSSLAQGFQKYGRLTDKQASAARKALKKYTNQLIQIANSIQKSKQGAL